MRSITTRAVAINEGSTVVFRRTPIGGVDDSSGVSMGATFEAFEETRQYRWLVVSAEKLSLSASLLMTDMGRGWDRSRLDEESS